MQGELYFLEELFAENGEVDFRTLSQDSSLRPKKANDHRFPVEMA